MRRRALRGAGAGLLRPGCLCPPAAPLPELVQTQPATPLAPPRPLSPPLLSCLPSSIYSPHSTPSVPPLQWQKGLTCSLSAFRKLIRARPSSSICPTALCRVRTQRPLQLLVGGGRERQGAAAPSRDHARRWRPVAAVPRATKSPQAESVRLGTDLVEACGKSPCARRPIGGARRADESPGGNKIGRGLCAPCRAAHPLLSASPARPPASTISG